MIAQHSLAARLTRYVVLGGAVVWLLGLVASALVLQSEQEELADATIQATARVFLPTITSHFRQRLAAGAATPIHIENNKSGDGIDTIEGALVFRLLDRSGAVLMQSSDGVGTIFPDSAGQGYERTLSHVFYSTAANSDGFVMQVGDPRQERREAFFDSFIALLVPMLAILPLAWLLVGWIGRRALAPLDRLRDEIAGRGDGRLDPIDAAGLPTELQAITASLNGFMIRLSRALDGERAFATSAAHELRTPVAVALAQVQRMRAEVGEAGSARLNAIEAALQRMTRLVVRLLQLARAEAGVGLSETTHDICKLLDLVLEDSRRDPARIHRLHVDLPNAPVLSRIDPDAFAMVVGNLIDNAFQHAPSQTPIEVVLSPGGRVSVVNLGPTIAPEELGRLKQRFQRGAVCGNGFGLGLYIADTIARHTGGIFDLYSPAPGRDAGFEAAFQAPTHDG